MNIKDSLSAVLALNVFDALATLTWVSVGIAKEANPLMDVLIDHSPSLFLLGKMMLVSIGCLILWKNRAAKVTLSVSRALVVIYTVLALYHLQGFVTIFKFIGA
jgi:hypothetical protein